MTTHYFQSSVLDCGGQGDGFCLTLLSSPMRTIKVATSSRASAWFIVGVRASEWSGIQGGTVGFIRTERRRNMRQGKSRFQEPEREDGALSSQRGLLESIIYGSSCEGMILGQRECTNRVQCGRQVIWQWEEEREVEHIICQRGFHASKEWADGKSIFPEKILCAPTVFRVFLRRFNRFVALSSPCGT